MKELHLWIVGFLVMGRNGYNIKDRAIYQRWVKIRLRCNNKNDPRYKYYGERGISFCSEWEDDFMAFYNYVICLSDYSDGMTLDRINNDGNYEPGNLRWTNWHVQAANKGLFSNNTSGFIGVRHVKPSNKYEAYICVNYKRIDFGRHENIEDAIGARNKYIIDNNLTEYKIQ